MKDFLAILIMGVAVVGGYAAIQVTSSAIGGLIITSFLTAVGINGITIAQKFGYFKK